MKVVQVILGILISVLALSSAQLPVVSTSLTGAETSATEAQAPSNSFIINKYTGSPTVGVTARTIEMPRFDEILPYCTWSGIYGMSYPAFTSFTVPYQKIKQVLPDLRKAGVSLGESSVVYNNIIAVDLKGAVTNADVISRILKVFSLPATEHVNTFRDSMTGLADLDYYMAFLNQRGVHPEVPAAEDYPLAENLFVGFNIAMVNGEKYKTQNEEGFWRVAAAYQQVEQNHSGATKIKFTMT